jgi:hypothetical protein
METNVRDQSIMQAVFRRRKRSARLSELARELERDVLLERPLEEGMLAISNESDGDNLAKSVVSPLIELTAEVEVAAEADTPVEKEDLSTPEELIPQLDLGSIPLTQPKRVMAKSGLGDQAMPSSGSTNNAVEVKATKSKTHRTKKPATFLDSYFKDL